MAILLDNWPTKLLAAIIAVVMWFYVLRSDQDTRMLKLPVVAENVPAELAVISITPDQAEVQVRGASSRLRQRDYERAHLAAELSRATVGEQSVPLNIVGLPPGVQAVPSYPSLARVRLDKVIERKRPLQYVKAGEPAPDFVIESIQTSEPEVTVKGAASIVARVARVVVVVDVSGLNSNMESESEFEARDLRDVVVSGLTFDPPRVKVTVVVRRLNTRTVPVRPIVGEPATGYRIHSVRVDPPVVTLTGEGGNLDAVESVPTLPIDISGLRSEKSYSVALSVPRGTSVVGPASVNVKVALRTLRSGSSGTPPAGTEAGGEQPSGTDEGAGSENVEPPPAGGEAGTGGATPGGGVTPPPDTGEQPTGGGGQTPPPAGGGTQ